MSGSFPTAGFTTMEFKSNTQTRTTQTLSGRVQRAQINSQYFSFKLVSPPLTRAEYMPIMAFIMKQGGKFDSFTVIPPSISSTRGTASGTTTVADIVSSDFSTAATSSTVPITNDGVSSGTLKTGDLIKFSNHDKVYMLTDDVNLDGSTIVGLPIFPSLRTAVSSSTTVQYNNVPFKVFLTSDVQQFNVGNQNLFQYEINVREDT
jgi:hypothetical protein